MHHLTCGVWNQLPSSFRQPHSVHYPPGSPHPAHITSSQSPPSLSSPITSSTFHSITPDLKLISFTNPFLHSHSYSFRTAFTDLKLYCIKGALALFVLVSFSGFRVHVKLFYRIVSYALRPEEGSATEVNDANSLQSTSIEQGNDRTC